MEVFRTVLAPVLSAYALLVCVVLYASHHPDAGRPPTSFGGWGPRLRLIAVTRIALPKARVRLAAGRTRLSREGQAFCFFAGANSIFYGDKLLTAKNPAADVDVALLRDLGLRHQGVTAS